MDTIRTHLLDASVLAKLVIPEYKSDVVRNYFNKHSVFWTTSFCLAEAFGVLKTKHIRFGKNFRFYERQEIVDWLNEYTEYFVKRCNWEKEEKSLIKKHRPPFNFIYNSKCHYPGLLELRRKAKALAMEVAGK